VIVNTNITTEGGDISITADRHINLNADVTTVEDGAIALWANRDGIGDGDVIQNVGTVKSVDGSIYVSGVNIDQKSPGVIRLRASVRSR